ncbi:MAG: peptidoglycan-binding protein [Lachnospiraceae bacterium]|nr:peptidoglycan-binding protein [Lachnospiraceae bacterium]
MKISDNGLFLIKKYEGCRLTAYLCPSGKPTIGYGHTAGVTLGMTITQAQADAYLKGDVAKFEKLVEKYHSRYTWNQNEFDALVSFAYNMGSIEQLTANGTRQRAVIAEKMLLYVKSNGKVLPGLEKRRKEEQELFLAPVEKGGSMSTTVSQRSTLKTGSRGEEVKALQEKLASIGYAPGSADGSFGTKTKAAVIAFQGDAGLTADGVVGAKTWAALDEIKVYSLKADGNKAISANFRVKEFACKDKSDTIVIHDAFVKEKLQKIRSYFGMPVTFNSAYRTPEHNKREGGASNSFHLKGRAFDIVVRGKTPVEVARYAASIGIKGVIQYSWGVHVDSRAVKYWAIDKNGKRTTVTGF